MQRLLLPMIATVALAAGCYTQGDVGVGYSYGYAAPAPSMYYVSPGVHVVAYSDYPVFYADNYYWRYDNGLWYRSSYYGGGWVHWHNPPHYIRSIDRPHRYVRYDGRWSRQPAYRPGPTVRDHRTYRGGYNGTYRAPAPAPGVRDHRTYSPARPQPVQTAPRARDHRTYTPAPQPVHRAPPPSSSPPVRDHRRR